MHAKVRVAPKGMGLNDFVAEQEGFFADEGIEVDWTLRPSVARSRAGRVSTTSRAHRTSPMPRATRKPDPVRLRMGQHLERLGRHGALRARLLRRLALGDLRAPRFQNKETSGSPGRSRLSRHARRQPLQRAVPARESICRSRTSRS